MVAFFFHTTISGATRNTGTSTRNPSSAAVVM